jgi:hypothetical protein
MSELKTLVTYEQIFSLNSLMDSFFINLDEDTEYFFIDMTYFRPRKKYKCLMSPEDFLKTENGLKMLSTQTPKEGDGLLVVDGKLLFSPSFVFEYCLHAYPFFLTEQKNLYGENIFLGYGI